MTDCILQADNLSKDFNGFRAVDAVWLAFNEGPVPHRIDKTCGNTDCLSPSHFRSNDSPDSTG